MCGIDYVLQRALTVADTDQKEALINAIKPHLASMRKYSSTYSKHLISSLFIAPKQDYYIN